MPRSDLRRDPAPAPEDEGAPGGAPGTGELTVGRVCSTVIQETPDDDVHGTPAATASDPARIETRADLARALTALRGQAGLSIRALARQLDTPVATIGDYCSGRHLPGPAQVDLFRALLAELGVSDAETVAAWLDALGRARHASDGRSARRIVPYRGLEPYGEEDAALFFGREKAAAMLLGRLASTGGILGLVGPSGSGKSSLIRAGILPAVRAGRLAGAPAGLACCLLTPGRAPLDNLGAALADGRADEPSRLFLVVDQVEEIFAAAVDPEERASFLAELAELARKGARVLVGLRADFYEAAAHEPVLLAVLRDNQVLLGPMTADEVRRAVVEPARAAGVAVAGELVDLLVADLAPRNPTGFAYERGALPLLSHALLAAWERAGRNALTVADYLSTGGIREAVRQSAEEVYRSLEPAGRLRARQVFLRLVNVGEDTPLTRRRVSHAELASTEGAVIGRFVQARLLTADAETIELSHEILLTAWPRLSAWIDEDRAGLRLHRQLGDVANAWIAAARDDALLLRGSRLQATAEWAADQAQPGQLNGAEQALLEASLAYAAAERHAARQRARRMRQLIAALVGLVAATSTLAVYAFDARRSRSLPGRLGPEASPAP